ncbi:MAG TPA: pyridoxal-phosphate dependent enzyme, partial [Pyrinomonadaceae bacterium]|nr:pyridoxal-phosphate dependent enzyme [Pyrinomonadaceae bacterium]
MQRCINVDCGSEFDLDERIYVCSRCGDLLAIEQVGPCVREIGSLRALWRERLKSHDVRDRSGVWRFREFLPFNGDVEVVSLGEGNTPLYDAPRSADYCGLASLKLKHQGNNPTGSFKDTGMTVAVTQARRLGMRLVACASTGNTAASLAA